MGKMLEEIRDEFLPESARSRKSMTSYSQTEKGNNHTKTSYIDKSSNKAYEEVSEEQAVIMNKHLNEMSEATLRSMLRCLKSTKSSPEVQKLVLIRLGELSAAE